MNNNKLLSRILLLALFVILPIISYIYLGKGLDERKAILAEMSDYGKLSATTLINQNGDTLKTEELEGKVTLFNFFSKDCEECQPTNNLIKRVLKDYEVKYNMFVVSATLSPEVDSLEALRMYAEEIDADTTDWQFVTAEKDTLIQLANTLYSGAEQKVTNTDTFHPQIVLVDKYRTIRKYYDPTNEEEIQRLLVHISLIAPLRPRAKIKYKRDREM